MILVVIVATVAALRSVYRHRKGLAEIAAIVLAIRAWKRR